jgi:precorrin-3B C17-methyltransferase
MRQEVSRVDEALDETIAGRRVVLVSSGDAGIYGMAGVALERAGERNVTVPIEIVAGVTASSAAAALLGAPLMLDFATLSLSDLLVPWETITRRLELAAEADFVIALYNPRSRTRTLRFSEARAILLRHRSPKTPVGLARGMGHPDESHRLTTLGDLDEQIVDMRTIVVVGNSTTRATAQWMFTPRGYFRRDP